MFAIRDDYQGWRCIQSAGDLAAGEFCCDTAPPTQYHRWRDGAWALDVLAQLSAAKAVQLTAINAAAASALALLSASYPAGEVASWPQQTREADALAMVPDTATPLLSAISAARDVPLADLASRVRDKVQAYAIASGQIIGTRQALEDALNAVDLTAPDAEAQLAAIQWRE